jgi:hypothetical protein
MEAASGSILTGTYTGGISLSPAPVIGFTDYFTFTDGGTGRFTYAWGGGVGSDPSTSAMVCSPCIWKVSSPTATSDLTAGGSCAAE